MAYAVISDPGNRDYFLLRSLSAADPITMQWPACAQTLIQLVQPAAGPNQPTATEASLLPASWLF